MPGIAKRGNTHCTEGRGWGCNARALFQRGEGENGAERTPEGSWPQCPYVSAPYTSHDMYDASSVCIHLDQTREALEQTHIYTRTCRLPPPTPAYMLSPAQHAGMCTHTCNAEPASFLEAEAWQTEGALDAPYALSAAEGTGGQQETRRGGKGSGSSKTGKARRSGVLCDRERSIRGKHREAYLPAACAFFPVHSVFMVY